VRTKVRAGAGEREQSGQGDIRREKAMLDVMMLVIGLGAFAPLIGYVALCERL
jgi:hypothetical protein